MIWYHFYNLKNVKNTHGGVILLVNLLAEACSFTKEYPPLWMFFPFFKLYKWYQIAQSIVYAKIDDFEGSKEFTVHILYVGVVLV